MPPDWDPQKEYDELPASQRAILENNFIGLSDGEKYYGDNLLVFFSTIFLQV